MPEVAERLGLDYVEVYDLLSSGMIYGRPNRAGEMRVTVSSVEQYEASTASSA